MSCWRNSTHFVSHINKWFVSIHYSSTDSAGKVSPSGQVFDNVQRAVYFNQRNKGVHKVPSVAKKNC